MDFIQQAKEKIIEEKNREEARQIAATPDAVVDVIKKAVISKLKVDLTAHELNGYICYYNNFYFMEGLKFEKRVPQKLINDKTVPIIQRKLQDLGFKTVNISIDPCYDQKYEKGFWGSQKVVRIVSDSEVQMIVHITWE